VSSVTDQETQPPRWRENGNGILPLVYPVTAAAYRHGLFCACKAPSVFLSLWVATRICFANLFWLGWEKISCVFTTLLLLSVLATVMFVSWIACIGIVMLQKWNRPLATRVVSLSTKNDRIRQINYRLFAQVIVRIDKRPCRLDTRGVTGVSSTEFGLMQEVSKWMHVNLHSVKQSTGHILCLWFRASLMCINNCPTRCNTKQSIYYSASSLHMFQVSTTPIIRSTQNCNYCLRCGQATLATLEEGNCTKKYDQYRRL